LSQIKIKNVERWNTAANPEDFVQEKKEHAPIESTATVLDRKKNLSDIIEDPTEEDERMSLHSVRS
jgi:hypothetical protein